MNARLTLSALAAVGWLTGCTGQSEDDLRAWMLTERNAIKPSVKPIPEPTKFLPHPYGVESQVPPFSQEKLASVLRGAANAPVINNALIAPELNRRKEPLEGYPLDTMTMVGSLDRKGKLVALVKVAGLLYQVQPGNYLGQNYGRVTRISETEIVLREIVQDAAGEWTERPATLQLVEGTSK